MSRDLPEEGRRRAMIEGVEPEIDCGRFAAKRLLGDEIVVEATAFTDGRDAVRCVLRHRHEDDRTWSETAMVPLGNDRWRGSFAAERLGRYHFTLVSWVDDFLTWRGEMKARLDADQEVSQPLLVGAELVAEVARRIDGPDRKSLERWADALRFIAGEGGSPEHGSRRALSPDLAELMEIYSPRDFATEYGRELTVFVDRARAGFSAWYELFPRSTAENPGEHGTFRDVEELLSYIRDMGFDVVYLPPIHPIGRTERKGPNNTVVSEPGDPGSPWGIGGAEGGHKAIHPELGTRQDFRRLVKRTRDEGMEIALDVAFQCSPDHPYVSEHPEWFRERPDGSIQFAENPPKKYQDIYPLDFDTDDWRGLWLELADVFDHWIGEGVRIFRVDNPHTKAFAFWEWLIARVKDAHPDVIFLSEAFTRPGPMYRLAKLGFTQSYTYFTWRNSKREIQDYVEELTGTEVREYFRPNFWPNTPDILHEYLQTGGRPAFVARLILAATLSSNYGVYGPAFELQESVPAAPGSEEYLHSEKYEIRSWDLDRDDSLAGVTTRMNRIRRSHPALQQTNDIVFHPTDNDAILTYSKRSADGRDTILVVVNIDPRNTRSGWVDLRLDALPVDADEPFVVDDLLGGQRFTWRGARNFVELDPGVVPAHVFHVKANDATANDGAANGSSTRSTT